MFDIAYWLIILLLVVVVVLHHYFKKMTIFEYERGLRYRKGQFRGVLRPGDYWIFTPQIMVLKIDIRPRFTTISGQEVLSTDGITLKVSLAAQYEVSDPYVAINRIANYQEALYLVLQIALRELVAAAKIDDLLAERNTLSQQLLERCQPLAQDIGLTLISVHLKDVMFPGELKKVFAQVVNAQKEGLAALEKARGETAALRNLANAAKLLENNPTLMQLRLIQSLEDSSGNTFVLGVPSPLPPLSER